MFCTYHTVYHGDKMPKNYIGSSSVERVEKGYRGTVVSKKYKKIWKEELKNNPHLFETTILTKHNNREEALKEELQFQKKNDVVISEEWINESFATVNGFFGRDVSGESNPNFGNGSAIIKWCKENPDKASERNRRAAKTQWSDPEQREKKIAGMKGKKKTLKNISEEEFIQLQREKLDKARERYKEKNCYRIYYNNVKYLGFPEFVKETGISKYRALQMAKENKLRIEKP